VAPPRFASNDTALLRRDPRIRRFALIALALGASGVAAGLALHLPGVAVRFAALLLVALAAAAIAALRNRKPQEVEGRVEADERGISFNGEPLLARAAVARAYVVPRGDLLPLVRVERSGLRSSLTLRVRDREQGRALLRALGFDGTQRAAVFRLPSRAISDEKLRDRLKLVRWLSYPVPFLVALGALAASHPSVVVAFLPLWLAAMAAQLGLLFVPTRLTVGADGLLVSWCGRSRFIPYSSIAIVSGLTSSWQSPDALQGIQLHLLSREVVRLWVDNADEIYERVEDAVLGWWRRDIAAKSALVARGSREASAWLRALDGIAAQTSVTYRTASMAEELWRIVEDVAAPADARAGAAVALRRSMGSEGRARLHKAAVTTAHPKLRVAIETAAEDAGDEALTAALAEVEDMGGNPGERRSPTA
jgi:hypothetical protein